MKYVSRKLADLNIQVLTPLKKKIMISKTNENLDDKKD